MNINLAGRLIPIEDTAYESLQDYLKSLSLYFRKEEGGEEIVHDIEDRIGEIFQEKLKKEVEFISDIDIEHVVSTMGRPEQLEEETSTEPQQKATSGEGEEGYTSEREFPGQGKKLKRDKSDKVLGGVCSGMANYFEIDPVVVRVLAILAFIFYGIGLLVYLVLWIALPGSESQQKNNIKSRIYRDPEHKVIGGVAAGLAAYFKVDVIIFRIIFLLPLLGFGISRMFNPPFHVAQGVWEGYFYPLSILNALIFLYFILWIVLPKAVTRVEKMRMRREKVDLESLSRAHDSSGFVKKK